MKMKNFPIDNYTFYVCKRKDGTPYQVIAVSTYAGRTVKGVAKCDPHDTFDLEAGKKLAAARCNLAVAQRRERRAADKYSEATVDFMYVQRHMDNMRDYHRDSARALDEAVKEIHELLKEM